MSASSQDYDNSERGPELNRRTFIGAVAGAAGLAGCSGEPEESGPEPVSGGEEESEQVDQSYSLSFQFLENEAQYDLTTLGTGILSEEYETRSDVTEDYSAEAELRILEGDEKISFEEIDELVLEDEYGREFAEKEDIVEYAEESEQGYILQLPEFLAEDGMTLKASVGDEKLTQKISVNKKLPTEIGVKAEMRIDGEHIADHPEAGEEFDKYETPFRFDTVNIDTATYNELMMQNIREMAETEVVEKTLEKKEHNFYPSAQTAQTGFTYSHDGEAFDSEHFSSISPENEKKIVNDGVIPAYKHIAKTENTSNKSGEADRMAATAARLADVHINDLDIDENRFEQDVEIDLRPGFSNSSRGHGHGPIFDYDPINGEWLVFDNDGAIKEPANVADAEDNSVFFAGADYELGQVPNTPYHGKKSEGTGFISNPFRIPQSTTNKTAIDDNWLNDAMQSPKNNEAIPKEDELILKQMMWAASEMDFQNGIIYGGDQGENHLMLNDSGTQYPENSGIFQAFRKQATDISEFRDDGDFSPVTKEEVEKEMMQR